MGLRKIGLWILAPVIGRKAFQWFFELLHATSLAGMNVGKGGGSPEGTGERHFLRWFAKTTSPKKGLVVFDVGANIGSYTNLLFDIFDDSTHIHSFEPSPTAYQELQAKASSMTNVRTYNFGFSDATSEVKLYTNDAGSVLGSLYPRNVSHHGAEFEQHETVSMRTIDDFCADNHISHIDLLKLDVEGHELKVLAGAKGMLGSGAIDVIQFEFGPCNVASRTFFQEFFEFFRSDYRLYRMVKDGLYAVSTYQDRYEMFLATNYVAVRKPLAYDP